MASYEALIRMRADTSEVKSAKRDLDNLTGSSRETKRQIEETGTAVDRTGRTMTEFTGKATQTTQAVRQSDSAFDALGLSAASASTKVNAASSGFGRIGKNFATVNSAARQAATSVQKTGDNVIDASSRFRASKGAISNLSFQLQDVAVQAQAGTSAFTILGQQGPQIASVFGPGGAVAGALIAFGALIGGVLYKTLGGAKDEVDRLADAMAGLELAFERTEQGSFILSQRLKELAQNSRELAEIELAIGIASAKIAFEEAQDAIVSSVSGITTAVNLGAQAFLEYGNASDYARTADANLRSIGERVQELQTRFGLSTKQAVEFGAAFATFRADQSAENLAALQAVVGNLGDTLAENANPELLALVQGLSENLQKADDASDALEMFGNALDGSAASAATLNDALTPATDSIGRMIEALKEESALIGKSAREKALYKAELEGASQEEIDEINRIYDKIVARNLLLDIEKRTKDAEKAAAKAADAKANAEEAAEKRKKESAQANLENILAIEKRKKESAQANLENILAMNDTEMEAFNRQLQEKRDRLAEDRAMNRITEQEHQQALTEITEAEATRRNQIEQRLASENTERLLGFSDMLLEGKSDKAKQAAALAINLADKEKRENAKQILSDSYSAAMKAYKALSGIPVIGPALGAAAAGVIIAAGATYSAKSLTGRALGGQVRPGESYVVGERGPEVLTMGNAGGRIATNESMRGSQPSLVYSPTVNISGGATEQDRALFTAQLRQQKAEIADLLARRRF